MRQKRLFSAKRFLTSYIAGSKSIFYIFCYKIIVYLNENLLWQGKNIKGSLKYVDYVRNRSRVCGVSDDPATAAVDAVCFLIRTIDFEEFLFSPLYEQKSE